jgi:hypothetical protein
MPSFPFDELGTCHVHRHMMQQKKKAKKGVEASGAASFMPLRSARSVCLPSPEVQHMAPNHTDSGNTSLRVIFIHFFPGGVRWLPIKMLIFTINTASYSLERRAAEGARTNELMPTMPLPLRPHVLPHVDDIAKSACPCAWLYFLSSYVVVSIRVCASQGYFR